MNAAVKKRWIKALRSGRYQQARERLHDGEEGFCCLGVLCDIEAEGDWVKDRSFGWLFTPDDLFLSRSDSGSLPMWFLNQTGLSVHEESDLINLNDDRGYTFDEIADWIEDKL